MTEQPPSPDPRDDALVDEPPAEQNETAAYSPPPEPRPEWTRSAWLDPSETAPAAMAPAEPVNPSPPAVTASGMTRPDGLLRILRAGLLSAVHASGRTVPILSRIS